MPGKRILELPQMDLTSEADQTYVLAAGDSMTAARLPITSIVDVVRRELGYVEKPLVKCRHCGQWGAVYCACAHCGAPIDPVKG